MPTDRTTAERRLLTETLAKGPFSAALRVAVQVSGLSLDRVQARLRERDVSLSKTALSNWQSGRTQPERPESRRALAALERVLGVPDGALARLVGPPRPRGRWVRRTPGDMRADQAWARPDGLARALARMGATPEAINHLARVTVQVSGEVDDTRALCRLRYQLVLRAAHDGVDRYTAAYRSDHAPPGGPEIEDTLGARLGRRRHDHETGFTTFELVLDQPLAAGELTTVDYTLAPRSARPEPYLAQRIGGATRVLSLRVRFAALPVRAHHRYLPSVADAEGPETELPLGASRTAQFVAADPAPGIYRLGWEWD